MGTQVTKSLRGVADCPFWWLQGYLPSQMGWEGSTPPALDPPVPIVAGEASKTVLGEDGGSDVMWLPGLGQKSDESLSSLLN